MALMLRPPSHPVNGVVAQVQDHLACEDLFATDPDWALAHDRLQFRLVLFGPQTNEVQAIPDDSFRSTPCSECSN
jgi:hypothetical protein